MRMVDEIELNKKQLEDQYQVELNDIKTKLETLEKVKEELNAEIQKLKNEKSEGLSEFSRYKAKAEKQLLDSKTLKQHLKEQKEEIELLHRSLNDKDEEHIETVNELRSEIQSIKESNASVIKLYEYQNSFFRERVKKEIEFLQQQASNPDLRDDSENYAKLLGDLSQRDAVCKSLKEENNSLKQQISKLKTKLKISIKKPTNIKTPEKNPFKVKKVATKEEPNVEKAVLSNKECQEIVKKITLLESENIKLSNEVHILSKKLESEIESKEELLEQIQELQSRSESQKAKKVSNKKELSSLTKQHKQEVQKLQEELKSVKCYWTSPEEQSKKEKAYEAQIKSLKEDLNRKKDLVASLKESQNKAEKEGASVVSNSESKKEDIAKISKLNKEVNRKEAMIKELRTAIEEFKDKEAKLTSENANASNKLKVVKADLSRKETMIKELKDKLDAIQDEAKNSSEKFIDQSKYKEMVKKYKQELERKDFKISGLESKLETNASELDKLKSDSMREQKSNKSESATHNKKYESAVKKMKKSESIIEVSVVVIRKIIKEMILSVEKLRSDVVIAQRELTASKRTSSRTDFDRVTPTSDYEASKKLSSQAASQANVAMNSDIYKESLDILGMSLNELDEFVQPEATLSNNLPIYDYTHESSLPSESKNTIGPGLQAEDLGLVPSSNKDLDVFSQALQAIVEDPEQLITESEDIIKIFKKLLAEIVSYETTLAMRKSIR